MQKIISKIFLICTLIIFTQNAEGSWRDEEGHAAAKALREDQQTPFEQILKMRFNLPSNAATNQSLLMNWECPHGQDSTIRLSVILHKTAMENQWSLGIDSENPTWRITRGDLPGEIEFKGENALILNFDSDGLLVDFGGQPLPPAAYICNYNTPMRPARLILDLGEPHAQKSIRIAGREFCAPIISPNPYHRYFDSQSGQWTPFAEGLLN